MEQHLFETFAPLTDLNAIRHAFTLRLPGIDVRADRETVLGRLADAHEAIRVQAGCGGTLRTVQQVHGNHVLQAGPGCEEAGADGLVTDDPGVCLGVYVADCGPVYAVDPVNRVIGLFHSGKKGTELGITTQGIQKMCEMGADPANMTVLLGPCIRPPHYDIDFAKEIICQASDAGVARVVDSGICTASDPNRYYSYRREKGSTGRMLALLCLHPETE